MSAHNEYAANLTSSVPPKVFPDAVLEQTESLDSGELRDNIAYEIYQDLQDFLISKLQAPTMVYIRTATNGLKSCFPRDRPKDFCTLCVTLKPHTEPSCHASCAQQEQEFIANGIHAEGQGEEWKWGWRSCCIGLLRYFVPIRSTSGFPSPILAVLVIGEGSSSPASEDDLRTRIQSFAIRSDQRSPPEQGDSRTLQPTIPQLETLLKSIPRYSADEQRNFERAIEDILPLIAIIASKTLAGGVLPGADDVVNRLGLGMLDFDMTQKQLWSKVTNALTQLTISINIQCAALFFGTGAQYINLSAVATTNSWNGAMGFQFPDLDTMKSMELESPVRLPSTKFSWIASEAFAKTPRSLIFSRSMSSGQYVLSFSEQIGALSHLKSLFYTRP